MSRAQLLGCRFSRHAADVQALKTAQGSPTAELDLPPAGLCPRQSGRLNGPDCRAHICREAFSNFTARRPTPFKLLTGHSIDVLCLFAAARAYTETGWTGGGLEAPDQIGHISFARVCPPSFAMTYLFLIDSLWEETPSVALRAPIGESYLQHICKHFTSWPGCQPQPVPTGKCGLCLANQPVCVHLAAGRISQGSKLSAATIAWASIKALVMELLCKKAPNADVNAQRSRYPCATT